MNRSDRISDLYRSRPRSQFLKWNTLGIVGLFAISVWWLDLGVGNQDWGRRWENLQRFAAEAYPYELRGQPFRISRFANWMWRLWNDRGATATAITFGLSSVAILLAGFGGGLTAFLAARNVMTTEPFLPGGTPPPIAKVVGWRTTVYATRGLFILTRAIPEYVWAFLLVGMIGPGAWPAILALAVHNFGILGKLGAEVVENIDPQVPGAMRGMGLSRGQIVAAGLIPNAMGKGLLFFFYRWETCVREAMVLGMLGVASLGYWVRDARARDRYDEMLAYVLMGAALVMLGDLASSLTRRYLRNR